MTSKNKNINRLATINRNYNSRLENFMKFDNFHKASTSNKKNPNWKEGNGQFIRKGIVGDWMNHFTKDLNTEYNTWIVKSLDTIGIQEPEVVGYFKLDVEFRFLKL